MNKVSHEVIGAGKVVGAAGVAAIPFVGGSIGAAMVELQMQRLSGRVQVLMDEVARLAGGMDAARIDLDYVHSDRFQDELAAAIDAAHRSSNRKKLRAIAALVMGSATRERPDGLDVEALLVAIRDLSPSAISLGLQILRHRRELTFGIVTGMVVPPEVPDRTFLLKRLEASGLIEEIADPGLGYGPAGGKYNATDTFERLLRLLESGGWTVADDFSFG